MAVEDKIKDLIVDRCIKRPFGVLARICHQVIDRLLIDDMLVHGPAAVLSAFGEMGRRLQSGRGCRRADPAGRLAHPRPAGCLAVAGRDRALAAE